MSASSTPTVAPESRSAAARLTATVDLPTPPLPEATAMVCLTPGIAWVAEWPLNAALTLAVIFSSTPVTPGMEPTRSRAIDWKRSRTGQAGVVSSKVNRTRPSPPTSRSLIMPRLTTSRWRSGSSIAASTASTCSVLGGELLGTEDHGRPQRHHADEHEQGDDHGVGACPSHHRGASRRLERRAPARAHECRGDSDQGQRPQRKQRKRPAPAAGHGYGHEKRDQEHQLEHREVAARQVQAVDAERSLHPVSREPGDQGGGATQAGREEEAAQGPGVAPNGLVADAQEHACVRG